MKFIEVFYWVFNIPYYRMMIVKDMEVLKILIQPVMANKKIKGSEFAFIDAKGKRAWFKMPEACFRDGKKFIGILDVDNAIQLVEETKFKVDGDGLIIKEMTITQLKNNTIEITDEKIGKMKKFVTAFPTSLLFEICSSHFVVSALHTQKDKTDWTLIIVLIAILLFGTIVYFFFMR